ncbi:MAG TPA: NADH-quinone oxidoreductase subunit J [Actinomycetes bacterium]|nr:NADH-quinone oxidoreductase subunit J [Actinomycetes bacterium]
MLATILFWMLAVTAVASGIGVFRVDSMARATFLLLASFLAVAAELLVLGLAYLGVVVVLMMTMEMVIMAVFMIMYMMNPAGLMPMSMLHNRRGSLAIAVGTFVALAAGILLVPWPGTAAVPPADATVALGEALMGSKMLVMLVIGIALFTTMVAAVVLATHRGRYDRYGDELDRPQADDPVPGGVGR